MTLLLRALVVALALAQAAQARPTEQERVKLWYEAGNKWPPNWQPETDGMKRLMDFREKEIMSIPGSDERWENWMQYTQSRLMPKFTDSGFLVAKTPKAVADKLKEAVDKCIDEFDSLEEEGDVNAIYSPDEMRPRFCQIGNLASETMDALKPYHEEWVNGMKLEGTSSYGVRLYRNGSSLVMHYDKMVCKPGCCARLPPIHHAPQSGLTLPSRLPFRCHLHRTPTS